MKRLFKSRKEKHLEYLKQQRDRYAKKYTQRILDLYVGGIPPVLAQQDELLQYYRRERDEHHRLIEELEEGNVNVRRPRHSGKGDDH